MPTALQFESIDFGYRRRPLFRGFDLTVEPGEMTGVLGPNGTGKTTLVRLASGFLRPSSGRVLLAGRDITGLPARERAQQVAVVPQDTHLSFAYSVREIVMMGRAPHQGLLGFASETDLDHVRVAMERTDTLALSDRRFHTLSGGERQRVIIARALAQQPRVLLLDEPTAFLDLKHRLVVYDLLARLNRETGLTLLVVSHDINLVARHCRRLVLLLDGRVEADGPSEAVLIPENIRRVYGVDVEVRPDPLSGRPSVFP